MTEARTLFVSGGSRGVGAGIVVAAAKAGFDVAFTYRSREEAAWEVVARAKASSPGRKIHAYALDVRVRHTF